MAYNHDFGGSRYNRDNVKFYLRHMARGQEAIQDLLDYAYDRICELESGALQDELQSIIDAVNAETKRIADISAAFNAKASGEV